MDRLDSIHRRLLDAITPIERERFSERPSQSEWSLAEVVHHLYLVEDRVIKGLEKALSGPPQRIGFLRKLVPTSIVATRFPRLKAPKAVTPLNAPQKEQAIENFSSARDRLKALCSATGEARLKQTVFKHPFLGNIDGIATISFVGYHEKRHYKQIREVIRKLHGSNIHG